MYLWYWWNKHMTVSALCPLFVYSNHISFIELLAIISIIIIVFAVSFTLCVCVCVFSETERERERVCEFES